MYHEKHYTTHKQFIKITIIVLENMDKIEPPKTIEEVGIHLLYMSQTIKKMSDKFDSFQSNYVPISVFLDYKAEMERQMDELKIKAEENSNFQSKWSGRVWGINMTIGAFYGILALVLAHYWK